MANTINDLLTKDLNDLVNVTDLVTWATDAYLQTYIMNPIKDMATANLLSGNYYLIDSGTTGNPFFDDINTILAKPVGTPADNVEIIVFINFSDGTTSITTLRHNVLYIGRGKNNFSIEFNIPSSKTAVSNYFRDLTVYIDQAITFDTCYFYNCNIIGVDGDETLTLTDCVVENCSISNLAQLNVGGGELTYCKFKLDTVVFTADLKSYFNAFRVEPTDYSTYNITMGCEVVHANI